MGGHGGDQGPDGHGLPQAGKQGTAVTTGLKNVVSLSSGSVLSLYDTGSRMIHRACIKRTINRQRLYGILPVYR